MIEHNRDYPTASLGREFESPIFGERQDVLLLGKWKSKASREEYEHAPRHPPTGN